MADLPPTPPRPEYTLPPWPMPKQRTPELDRLEEDDKRSKNWKRWGTYLSERQWGTVREDYSANGDSWNYFPHDHARSRTYRWGEDGLLGWTDRECRLCFGLALWNEQDSILKERLFGVTGPEGNHGEDVKELYYYLDATPTHSYAKGLYKYPQKAYPYDQLVSENSKRSRLDPEYELLDTGIFDDNRYFDVLVEYAKGAPNDILIKITISNRGPESAKIHVLPQLWYRNTWIWGCQHEGCTLKPRIKPWGNGKLELSHPTLEPMEFYAEASSSGVEPRFVFTENETNTPLIWDQESYTKYFKDAFHQYIIHGKTDAVNPEQVGTKAAAWYALEIPAGETQVIRCRLCTDAEAPKSSFGKSFEDIFKKRIQEADAFYDAMCPGDLSQEERNVQRQSYAGLLWTKQFYHYSVYDWLKGDPNFPKPPRSRKTGRNADWLNLFNRDVISMPDKWEYPWYASWDLAFHMIPFSKIDPNFAKDQLKLLLREWYMHPSGQIPAYEYNFSDVNPPVHAWACWRIYKMTGARESRDVRFLAEVFHKLLINFTWWVNRKDPDGKNIFSGGFLGLDNIGAFDRSKPFPPGVHLSQADGTAWMAFYCSTMLSIALELAYHDPSYDGVASKFFEHFMAITDAINKIGKNGLWDEEDGFYYDQLVVDNHSIPIKTRSLVGLIPLLAVEILQSSKSQALPEFRKRTEWFLKHRQDIAQHIAFMECSATGQDQLLLAIPSRSRLERVLKYVLDENEFLSPYGIRSLSKYHEAHPFEMHFGGETQHVKYVPGDSDSALFGGNSNWRGPIWFPLNFLLLEALEKYHHFYGDSFEIEFPTGSGLKKNLKQVAEAIGLRLIHLFLPEKDGKRPIHGCDRRYADDPNFKDLVLFYEYFHGDTGKGIGASHQTGWTALVTKFIDELGRRRNLAQEAIRSKR